MSNQDAWEEQAVPRCEPALESLGNNRLAATVWSLCYPRGVKRMRDCASSLQRGLK